MYAVTVTFRLHPGRIDDFLPLMLDNARASRRDEPECRQFDVCVDRAADRVFLYELYTARAAFDAHLAAAHFQAFDAAVADMIADKTVQCYAEVLR